MVLNHYLHLKSFQKWCIDFVGPFKIVIQIGNRYIVAIDYCIKWIEARTICNNKAMSIAKFLYKMIINRLGCPIEFVSDQVTRFMNKFVQDLM